jgi:AcrR family transcriptional regulator
LRTVAELAELDEEITVRSVTSRAGISRAGFYTHFVGINDLALYLQETAFHELSATANELADGDQVDPLALFRSQQRLLRHYAFYRDLYRRVFAMAVPRGVESAVANLMTTEIYEYLTTYAEVPESVDARWAARYLAHGATGLIIDWVLGDIVCDVDEVASHLYALVPAWMREPVVRRLPAGSTAGM